MSLTNNTLNGHSDSYELTQDFATASSQEVVRSVAVANSDDSTILQAELQQLRSENELLRQEKAALSQQLAFYSSFDNLLHAAIKQPITEVIELAARLHDQAQAEAARIIADAYRERDRLLADGSPLNDSKPAATTALTVANAAPANQLATLTNPPAVNNVLELVAGHTEVVVAGFKSISQVVEFQKALLAIPQVSTAKVRLVQKGVVNLEVAHEQADLAGQIEKLAGFALRLTAKTDNLLRFEVVVENNTNISEVA